MYPPSMVAAACISTAILGLSAQATSNNVSQQQKQQHNWQSQSQLQMRINEITGIEAVRSLPQPLVLSYSLSLSPVISSLDIGAIPLPTDVRPDLRQETGNGCCRMSKQQLVQQLIVASLIGRGIGIRPSPEMSRPSPPRPVTLSPALNTVTFSFPPDYATTIKMKLASGILVYPKN